MKMETVNISLTAEQSEYVRRTVAREFGNTSEFFRELLRSKMKKEIQSDLDHLQTTIAGAPAGPDEAEIEHVLAVQRQVRKEYKRASRP